MNEICRCVCGGEAVLSECGGELPDRHYVECIECAWCGPPKTTPEEAVAAWNPVMRPRPKVELVRRERGVRYVWDLNSLAHANQYSATQANACMTGGTRWFDSSSTAEAEKHIESRLYAAGFDIERSGT